MKNFPRWLLPVIALVSVFLLVSGVLYVKGVNQRAYVETNGTIVQVAGRARLEWQKIMRYLNELKFGDTAQRAEALLALRKSTKTLGDSVTALHEGGTMEIRPNDILEVPPGALSGDAKEAANALNEIYREVEGRVNPMIAGNNPEQSTIDKAFDYANSRDKEMAGALTAAVGQISNSSYEAARGLGKLQTLGTILGTLFIATLIGLYSFQLRKVGAAKKETDEILQTVPTGLFLLDKNMKVGAQYSAQLEKILAQKHIAGRDFSSVFGGMADADTLTTARDYLGLLIADQVDENLIADVNPLDCVSAVIPNESGRPENRYLGFGFKRVMDKGKLSHLLVTVNDITEKTQLAAQVSKLEKQMDSSSGQTLELISSALSMERPILNDRLARYEQLLDEANGFLKESSKGSAVERDGRNATYRTLVDQVFRPLHTLKGETAALGFKALAGGAGDVEAELMLLKQKADLTGNDFLSVTLKLDEVYARLGKLRQLVAKLPDATTTRAEIGQPPSQVRQAAAPSPLIQNFPSSVPAPAPTPMVATPSAAKPRFDFALIQQACVRTAEKLGKKVAMQGQNLAAEVVPDALKQTMTDVLVQLVRNALAHGIETPAQRLAANKPETGRIQVQWASVEGGHELLFRDDGHGLDFESIRTRAVALNRLSAQAAAALDPRQLAGFIFEPGFSTAAKTNDTAGFGVGLDVVMAAVKRVGGKIAVGTQPGQYTQFRVRFPSA
jgi:two-component system, chemotaxis family, sensor kinase CheA